MIRNCSSKNRPTVVNRTWWIEGDGRTRRITIAIRSTDWSLSILLRCVFVLHNLSFQRYPRHCRIEICLPMHKNPGWTHMLHLMSVTLGNNVTSPLTRSHTDKHLSWPWSERCWVSKVDKNALNIEGSCWLTGNVSSEVYCDEWNLYFLYVWAKPQVMEETSFAIDNDNETIPSRKIILANKFSSLSLTSLSIQTNTFSI